MADRQVLSKAIRAFWNRRAQLKEQAGTRDVIAKRLEIEAIAAYIRDGSHILDAGCGDGTTAIELAKRHRVDILGIDFAEQMVTAATALALRHKLKGSVTFNLGDVRDLSGFSQKFDLIYTERTLINLSDWPTQQRAIINITSLLVHGGLYVMCENSQDGLNKINALRQLLGLSPIEPPWHNRYLRDAELQKFTISGVALEGVVCYSSTYYFLSRVVNAWLAAQEGQEPDYEAPINQLALRLPPIGDLGQGRIWLWRKAGAKAAPSAN